MLSPTLSDCRTSPDMSEVREDFKKVEGEQKDDGHRHTEMCPRVTDPAYWANVV